MGQMVSVYRSTYDSESNLFHGAKRLTLVNVEGPFEPNEDAPAAMLSTNSFEQPIVVPLPADHDSQVQTHGRFGPMFGGTYVATSDSRFTAAVGGMHAAVPLHDRYEAVSRG